MVSVQANTVLAALHSPSHIPVTAAMEHVQQSLLWRPLGSQTQAHHEVANGPPSLFCGSYFFLISTHLSQLPPNTYSNVSTGPACAYHRCLPFWDRQNLRGNWGSNRRQCAQDESRTAHWPWHHAPTCRVQAALVPRRCRVGGYVDSLYVARLSGDSGSQAIGTQPKTLARIAFR
jgi:hypothetical protein